MNEFGLATEAARSIGSMAKEAMARLSPSQEGYRFARIAASRPVDYMRYAEFETVLANICLETGFQVLDISSPQCDDHKQNAAVLQFSL